MALYTFFISTCQMGLGEQFMKVFYSLLSKYQTDELRVAVGKE